MLSLHLCPLIALVIALALAAVSTGRPEEGAQGRRVPFGHGESLVLAGMEPGQLAHHRLAPGSVVVRSTYLTDARNSLVYRAGQDYQVDRKKPEDLLANNVNRPNDFGHRIYFQVLEWLGS